MNASFAQSGGWCSLADRSGSGSAATATVSAAIGDETVESPTAGERWDVPLNTWNPAGPYGAGYYRTLPGGGVQLLESM